MSTNAQNGSHIQQVVVYNESNYDTFIITMIVALFINNNLLCEYDTPNIDLAYFLEYAKENIIGKILRGKSIFDKEIQTLSALLLIYNKNIDNLTKLYRGIYDYPIFCADISSKTSTKDIIVNPRGKLVCMSINRKDTKCVVSINKYIGEHTSNVWQFSSMVCYRGYYYSFFYLNGEYYLFDLTMIPAIVKVDMKELSIQETLGREVSFIIYSKINKL